MTKKMAYTPSPLRYPGGKASIWKIVAEIIADNDLNQCDYVEPYAGGCGLALSLMFKGYVHNLHLNDIDRSVYSFWSVLLNRTDDLVEKIQKTDVTIDEWYLQREIQKNKDEVDEFDLAFSSFFLNRTNRSGIILKAGVIGGYKQNGNYKLDCRFNKKDLIARIRRIEKYKHRICFYNMDAIDFITFTRSLIPQKKCFYYIDPPYFAKGSTLYTNSYKLEDHSAISKSLHSLKRPWLVTYDDVFEIRDLYKEKRQYRFNLNYSAGTKRLGTELLVASDDLLILSDKNFFEEA